MSAQWVLSGLIGSGCLYALDITVPAGTTQIVFVTSFPEGISALTEADADALAGSLRAAAAALPGATVTLSPVTFNGMTAIQFPGAVPADLVFPAATWVNYAASFLAADADGKGLTVSVQAGMIAASPADGVLTPAGLGALNAAWARAAAALPAARSPVSPVRQVISPASVI